MLEKQGETSWLTAETDSWLVQRVSDLETIAELLLHRLQLQMFKMAAVKSGVFALISG